jgi:hypothetical protein
MNATDREKNGEERRGWRKRHGEGKEERVEDERKYLHTIN